MESESLPLYTSDYQTSENTYSAQPAPKMLLLESSSTSTVPVAGKRVTELPVGKLHILGPSNSVTTCHFCHKNVKTTIKHTITSRTHMTAALCSTLCALCCIPCCIYCCFNSAKNTDHYCPSCQTYLGTYEK